MHTDRELNKEFDEKVPGYSMEEVGSSVVVPIMVQRQDALDFIEALLKRQREELVGQVRKRRDEYKYHTSEYFALDAMVRILSENLGE